MKTETFLITGKKILRIYCSVWLKSSHYPIIVWFNLCLAISGNSCNNLVCLFYVSVYFLDSTFKPSKPPDLCCPSCCANLLANLPFTDHPS